VTIAVEAEDKVVVPATDRNLAPKLGRPTL
jgi:hypothetical protein